MEIVLGVGVLLAILAAVTCIVLFALPKHNNESNGGSTGHDDDPHDGGHDGGHDGKGITGVRVYVAAQPLQSVELDTRPFFKAIVKCSNEYRQSSQEEQEAIIAQLDTDADNVVPIPPQIWASSDYAIDIDNYIKNVRLAAIDATPWIGIRWTYPVGSELGSFALAAPLVQNHGLQLPDNRQFLEWGQPESLDTLNMTQLYELINQAIAVIFASPFSPVFAASSGQREDQAGVFIERSSKQLHDAYLKLYDTTDADGLSKFRSPIQYQGTFLNHEGSYLNHSFADPKPAWMTSGGTEAHIMTTSEIRHHIQHVLKPSTQTTNAVSVFDALGNTSASPFGSTCTVDDDNSYNQPLRLVNGTHSSILQPTGDWTWTNTTTVSDMIDSMPDGGMTWDMDYVKAQSDKLPTIEYKVTIQEHTSVATWEFLCGSNKASATVNYVPADASMSFLPTGGGSEGYSLSSSIRGYWEKSWVPNEPGGTPGTGPSDTNVGLQFTGWPAGHDENKFPPVTQRSLNFMTYGGGNENGRWDPQQLAWLRNDDNLTAVKTLGYDGICFDLEEDKLCTASCAGGVDNGSKEDAAITAGDLQRTFQYIRENSNKLLVMATTSHFGIYGMQHAEDIMKLFTRSDSVHIFSPQLYGWTCGDTDKNDWGNFDASVWTNVGRVTGPLIVPSICDRTKLKDAATTLPQIGGYIQWNNA